MLLIPFCFLSHCEKDKDSIKKVPQEGLIAYLCLALMLFSCTSRKQDPGDEMPRLYPPPITVKLNLEEGYSINPVTCDSIYPLINSSGDTISTGIAIPARGRVIPVDSIPPPVRVPAGIPRRVRAHQNVHRIPENLTRIPFPEERRGKDRPNPNAPATVNSRGDTIPTGVPVKLKGKVVPCLQPEPVPALPPDIKKNALYDIRYLDVCVFI